MTIARGIVAVATALWACAAPAKAPESPTTTGERRPPPPQAYADCGGKQVGAAVQHTTPEGKVAAVCAESPKGLVARPVVPKEARGSVAPPADRVSPR
ncbi:MAG: hypothetical protein U1F10_08260 [Burkholderiales bacterium]